MTKPTGYWCPMCGDLPETSNPFPWMPGQAWHHGACDFRAIPVCTPLDVPEPTTWGESHPVGAVCAYFEIDDCPYQMLVCGQRLACIDGDAAAVAGPRVCHDVDDVVQAINYVAGET